MNRYKTSEQRTIGFIVEDRALTEGDRPFLLFKDEKHSYKELNERSNKVANLLIMQGVRKNDKIVTLIPNIPEYFYVWWGIVKIGAWEVPVNLNYRGASLADLINRCDAQIAVIYHKMVTSKFLKVFNKLKNIKKLIIIHRLNEKVAEFEESSIQIPILKLSDAMAMSADMPMQKIYNYDPASIVYTSGTTGPPKPVIIQHEFWIHASECKNRHMGTKSKDIIYNCFPMFNPTGQVETSLCALLANGKVAMAEKFDPKSFWPDIKKYNCTETVSMGGAFSLVEKNPPGSDDKCHPLKKIYIIPVPVEFQKRCESRFGIKMMEFYGQTESNLVCFRTWNKGKMGSCGFANSGYEIKIFDENDNECPANVEGEIVIRPKKSHIIALGYYKMPEKYGERMRNCWWHTGDLGRMDKDGHLYFHRRKEETIRFRGYFVSTTEVEAILNQHPAVLESAAYGVPDELGQEQDVMAAIKLKENYQLAPDELLRHCENDLPFYMIPAFVRFVKKFKKTPTLRIIKAGLQKEGVTPDTWSRRAANFKLSRE